jgi:hypothetical protein
MSRTRHKPEEIVSKLRQVDVLTAQGMPVGDAARSIGVTEVGFETNC